MILLSYINTKLRDEYSSLGELCSSLGIDETDLSERLGSAGYTYITELNCFR